MKTISEEIRASESSIQEHEPALLQTIRNAFSQWLCFAEVLSLIVIGVISCWCFVNEIWTVVSSGKIHLADILTIFLYSEVIVMVSAAIRSRHEVLITIPVAIAIVALSRAMVISTDHNPEHAVLQASAILMLIFGLVLWYLRDLPKRLLKRSDKAR